MDREEDKIGRRLRQNGPREVNIKAQNVGGVEEVKIKN
jgi:hypothetical protein